MLEPCQPMERSLRSNIFCILPERSSNVVYVGSTPYCKKNLEYTIKQSKKFLEGKSPPDFAPEDYEINYKGRIKLENLSNLAKKQLALE